MKRITKQKRKDAEKKREIKTDVFNTSCKSVKLFDFEMILPGNSVVRVGEKLDILTGGLSPKSMSGDILSILRSAVADCGVFDGVLVSGGIDSSVIAAIAEEKIGSIRLFVAGFPSSDDVAFSEILGSSLGVKVDSIILDEKKIEKIIKKLKAFGLDTYSVIIGIVEYAAIEYAASHGCRRLLSGVGSDELFLGFSKHREEKSVAKLKKMRESRLSYINVTDLYRIKTIADKLGVEVLLPYLNEKVVNFALNMHIKSTQYIYRKTLLRSAGKQLGLDERIVERNKKAMQYGSGVMKHLERIAREHGVKNVGEYIKRI